MTSFADKLKEYDIEYVHPIMEHFRGSESFASMIRISILSKSENGEGRMQALFWIVRMTPEQAAKANGCTMKFVNACMR